MFRVGGGPGIPVPLTFQENLPYVKARVVLPDGRSISGKFVIVTGASTSLILSPGPVEREGIMASIGKTMIVRARGVGGATDVRLARVASLELGGFALAAPIVALQPAGADRISAPGTLGNIGGGILNRFKVVFDYPRRRMILEPGPDIAQPFEADMSGLGLVTIPPDHRRVTVARVLDGSPALEVGLPALRDKLRVEGQELRLELRRGTERITLALRTRRMI